MDCHLLLVGLLWVQVCCTRANDFHFVDELEITNDFVDQDLRIFAPATTVARSLQNGPVLPPETESPITLPPKATSAPVVPTTPAPITAAPITEAPITIAPAPITPAPITPAPIGGTIAPKNTPMPTTEAPITLAPVTQPPIRPKGTQSPVTPTTPQPTLAPVTFAPIRPKMVEPQKSVRKGGPLQNGKLPRPFPPDNR